jgi:hypothetical protein
VAQAVASDLVKVGAEDPRALSAIRLVIKVAINPGTG